MLMFWKTNSLWWVSRVLRVFPYQKKLAPRIGWVCLAAVFIMCLLPLPVRAEWINDGGPYGGRILAIELFGDDDLLVGTRNAGVFISGDGALTWEASNAGLGNLIVTCTAVNRLNSNTAYIGTSGEGIYRTIGLQGDATWTNYSYNIGNRDVQCLVMCPGDTNTLFVGTVNGLFKTSTGGGYWEDVTDGLPFRDVAAVAFGGSSADVLYAGLSGYGGGVFKSTDGGMSWVARNGGLTNSFVTQIRADPLDADAVWVSTSGGGVFKSVNGGALWTARNGGLGNLVVRDIFIVPDNPQVLYAGTAGGVFVTVNGGGAWTAFNSGLTDVDIHVVAGDDAGSVLYGGGYWAGIYKSTAGGPWAPSVHGMTNTFITDIDCHPFNEYVVQVSSYGQVFLSDDDGTTWLDRSDGIGDEALIAIAIDQAAPDTIYCGANYGGVYKSTDGGLSWNLMNSGLTATDITCLRIAHVGGAPYVYAGTYNFLFRSTDGARSWQLASVGITDKHIWTIEIDPSVPTTVYAGTYGGGIFKSVNAGDSWFPVNGGLGSIYIAAVAVDPMESDVVYAGAYYGGGVFKSEDGGTSWAPSSAGMPNASVWSLDVNPLDSRQVIAGTLDGVFLSVDRGETWRPFSEGLEVRDARCVMFHRLLGAEHAFAGTYGGGVYVYDDVVSSVGVGIAGRPLTPRILRLENYPNPFNPSTTIRYEISDISGETFAAVTLDVYDVRGKLVKSLVDWNEGPGVHEVCWAGECNDGGRAASGMYLVRLRAGRDLKSIKMVMLQ